MHLTFDPLFLLTALAFLLPWSRMATAVRRLYFATRANLLRRSLERALGARILVLCGRVERFNTFTLVKAVHRAKPTEHLMIVLDTGGGDLAAGLQLQHALSGHPGRVTAVVPDEAWSSGTLIALAADVILMAPSANLGPCDGICHVDPGSLLTGPVVTSAATGDSVDLVRARHNTRDVAIAIKETRIARGEGPLAAQVVADRLVFGDTDHFHPIFPEEAKRMGLPVADLPIVERWWKLIYFATRSG